MRFAAHSRIYPMILMAAFLSSCSHGLPGEGNPDPAEKTAPGQSLSSRQMPWPEAFTTAVGESSQVLLVLNDDPAAVRVQVAALEKRNGRWRRPFVSVEGMIGQNGFAPPGEKREGDGRTPSGVFPLGLVFGYPPSAPTKMPYRQATERDLWVDDVAADDYNRWATKGTTKARSFETMRRADGLYKLGVVVEYNTNPVIKGHGSAIFFHLWRGRGVSTAGCIAIAEEDLRRIVEWLDPAARPVVFLGMNERGGRLSP
jgi:L,D-peptidoglycan transpeptidase YkuD (ErfK/YbiS/YcfS/YnhG family)